MKKIYISFLCLAVMLLCVSCAKESDKNGVSQNSTTESTTDTTLPEIITPEIIESTQINISNEGEKASLIIKGAKDDTTLSGLGALEGVTYSVPNENTSLSSAKVSHSHGPASGGKAHHTVIEFQKTFEKYGAVTLDTKTDKKALYLTFDCGYEYENLTNKVLDVLSEKGVNATFFCTLDHIKSEHELIARMIKEGHIVGNHSTTHPSFAEINTTQMVKEIEQTENYLRENFGYAAKVFRFPKGEYNEKALSVVQSLGYMSVFWSVAYDDWNTDTVRGKDYAIEKVLSRLHDGAIILLHSVSKDNAEALGEIIDKAREQGYEFYSLQELYG